MHKPVVHVPFFFISIWTLCIVGVALGLPGCHTYHAVTGTAASQIKMTASITDTDRHIDSLTAPYRVAMEQEMNEVLVQSETVLTKQQPESTLGNLLADIQLQKAREYTGATVDVAIINYGGIRLPQLPQGNITRGKVYELMPFDNMLVVVELDAATTKQLFDLMAAWGGIPLAGARYEINKEHAENISINGQPLSETRTYRIALSDYLANGGDKLDFLKGKKQIPTNRLLRDAFIEAFMAINQRGEKLKAMLDGRVK